MGMVYESHPTSNMTTRIQQCGSIEFGYYTGTGTFGSSNPTSITFNTKPSFVILFSSYYDNSSGTSSDIYHWGNGIFPFKNNYEVSVEATHTSFQFYTIAISVSDKTASWYHASKNLQRNWDGVKYYYAGFS